MENEILLVVLFLMEGVWAIDVNGWGPLVVDNLETCLDRKETLIQTLKDIDVTFQVMCGTQEDIQNRVGTPT